MSLGLAPSEGGVSELWRWAEPTGCAALALGGASNAAAAVQSGVLLGARVSHIISVGSYRNFKALTTMQMENGHADIQLQYFQMSDWLRPDEKLDLRHDLAEPLQALQAAVQPAEAGGDRVVLVHCDQGHNRSPTLALAFFVCNGHTLRQAYCRLLRARMDVDPLPPYRRGLEQLEVELRGERGNSVSEHDIFALHVTQLMSLPNLHELAETCPPPPPPPGPVETMRSDDEREEVDEMSEASHAFEVALAVRRSAIATLLAEQPAEEMESRLHSVSNKTVNVQPSQSESARQIVFLHIPKTAGTSFFADAMFMIPSNMSFLDNGELSLLGTPHVQNETRVVMIRSPLDHVLSQFLECKFDWWGKRVTAGTDFPFKPGVYGGLYNWVRHFTDLKNESVQGFPPDSKEWARAVSHNCYNPWNMQSRYLASVWDHYVPFDELQPDIKVARQGLQSVQVVGVPELYVESLCLVHLETHGHLPEGRACGQQGPIEQISTESHYVPNHSISELPDDLLAEMSKLVRVDAQIYVDALNRFELAARQAADRTGIQMFCDDRLDRAWANANSLLQRLGMENASELQRAWNHVRVEIVVMLPQGRVQRKALPKELTGEVASLGRRGLWAAAIHKVEEARSHQLLDVVLCNAAVTACARSKAWQAALAVLQSMAEGRPGLPEPDLVTFNSALNALASSACWREASWLLSEMCGSRWLHILPNIVSYNTVLRACARSSSWQAALQLLSNLCQQRPEGEADLVSFNTAISACERSSQWQRCSSLLANLGQRGLQPDTVSLNTVLSSFARGDEWQRAIFSVQIMAALLFWILMSATMIIFNAALLQGFRHPVWLTFWHMSASTILILVLKLARPDLVATGDEKEGRPPLAMIEALKLGFPVAAAQCVGLIAGNTAVMYLSVSFCQMIKAWTPAMVYAVGCLVGTQKWSIPVAKTILTITVGLMITSVGEIKFDWYGFLMQVTALFSEGLRINLLEILLKSAGYKLNPLSSILIFAPIASAILLVIGVVTDLDGISFEVMHQLGELVMVANALVAFFLNIAIYIAIQLASGLIYALAGVVKDISIIMGSVVVMGSTVNVLQVVGYSIAITGIQCYGVVSKAPANFEAPGIVYGVFRHFQDNLAPSLPAKDLDGQRIGATNEAMLLFEELLAGSGPVADSTSLGSVLSACERVGLWQAAWSLLGRFRGQGLEPQSGALRAALSALRSGGRWQEALLLLGELEDSSSADVVAFSAAMAVLEMAGSWQQAFSLLAKMRSRAVAPDSYTYSALLGSCRAWASESEAAALNTARALLADARDSREANEVVIGAMLRILEFAGLWAEALDLLRKAPSRRAAGREPNLINYASAASACAKGQKWECCLDLLRELEEAGTSPDIVLLSAVISACAANVVLSGSERWQSWQPPSRGVLTRCQSATGTVDSDLAAKLEAAKERVAQAKEAVSLFRTELCGRNFLSPEINQPLLTEIFLSFVPKSAAAMREPILDKALAGIIPDIGSDVEALVALVGAMATARLPHDPAWQLMADAVAQECRGASARQLTAFAWAFATAREPRQDLWDSLKAAMAGKLGQLSADERVTFAWSCAEVNQHARDLFGDVSEFAAPEASAKMIEAIQALPGQVLLADPVPIRLVPDVLVDEQGQELIRIADDAQLWSQSSRRAARDAQGEDALRTSSSAILSSPSMFGNPAVQAVRSWASKALQVPEDFVEALQLVRYRKGEQYSTHVDWGRQQDASLWLGGQRTATALIYLNSLPDGCGGETSFERLGVSVRPQAGAALVWPNVDAEGRPQNLVEHRALPLLCDFPKYAVNVWIREKSLPAYVGRA
ncbi:unnamed protein product [Symbiodinium sp. CCMP2456]|nr:unnamed protein product [Symbiodinium sp. CCMP2456]